MADLKDKVQQAGHRVSEKATEIGHSIGEGVEKAADWAKEKAHQVGNTLGETKDKVVNRVQEAVGSSSSASGSCGVAKGGAGEVAAVQERMDVISSCGCKIGVVDHVEGNRLKLTKNDSPDGQHHYIPGSWIARVDDHVHLSKNASDAKRDWSAA
ncbi:MAG: DUF2171 domain-containing protein [Gemmataceae bacterium]